MLRPWLTVHYSTFQADQCMLQVTGATGYPAPVLHRSYPVLLLLVNMATCTLHSTGRKSADSNTHTGLCHMHAGRDAAQVPLASSMRIASISIPRVALLEAPTSKGKESDSAGGPMSTDTMDHVVDRSDRTAEAGTSGQSSDEARQAEEDKLVAELQQYFQRSTRCNTLHMCSGRSFACMGSSSATERMPVSRPCMTCQRDMWLCARS